MNEEQFPYNDSEDLNLLPLFLRGKEMKVGQDVPDTYFGDLPGRIQDRIDDLILSEENPVFSSIPKPGNSFVSDEYFDEMAAGISSGLLPDNISESAEVPSLYFKELPGEIETAIRLESLNILKEDPFVLEADYFDWLPSRIRDRIQKSSFSEKILGRIGAWLNPRILIPAGLSFALILLIGIRSFYAPALPFRAPAALNLSEKDKSEYIENFELLGFEDGIVSEHLATAFNISTRPSQPNGDAIEYLIDENTDLNTTPEN